MNSHALNQELLDFLHFSPTPFHAVSNMSALLEQAGFTALSEGDGWSLEAGGRYYVTRNGSALCAFALGTAALPESGIRIVGAHSDSPCLKIKPSPDLYRHGYYQLGVEVYGGALLNPWFDRDLSIAGRVSFVDGDDHLNAALIDFERPCALIPSLAIHLDPEVNQNRSVNAQSDIIPLLLQHQDSERPHLHSLLHGELLRVYEDLEIAEILDYELFLYDTQPPDFVGLNQDFIASARLDNLLSCYVGLRSLIDTDSDHHRLLICNDHEEVGSVSAAGAQGTFLSSILQRLTDRHEDHVRMIDRSLLVSTDNAHGVHPNFSDKHDENHRPRLNHGPVIKLNANQRYASNSETAALFRYLCRQADIPVQNYVVRNDMRCGSTIGPLTAAETGIRTLDIGVATFAMHSIRELAGQLDSGYLYQALCEFYRSDEILQNGP